MSTTTPIAASDLLMIQARIASAKAELARVCTDSFKMRIHIPEEPGDSDTLIGDGLDAAVQLIGEVHRLRRIAAAAARAIGPISAVHPRDYWEAYQGRLQNLAEVLVAEKWEGSDA